MSNVADTATDMKMTGCLALPDRQTTVCQEHAYLVLEHKLQPEKTGRLDWVRPAGINQEECFSYIGHILTNAYGPATQVADATGLLQSGDSSRLLHLQSLLCNMVPCTARSALQQAAQKG